LDNKDIYQKLTAAVLEGEEDSVFDATSALLENGVNPLEIINQGLIGAMDEVGQLFKEGELFVPEVMMAAQTVSAAIDRLKPLLKEGDQPYLATVVIGTVKGDLHDIGKNLVALLLENSGFAVINLGVDVSSQKFIDAVVDYNAQIVAMSALLTTTMLQMEETINAFAAAGMRDKVKIIVGGAPLSNEFANSIGADGYSEDALGAVRLCKQLMSTC